jgi:proteasome lid subunit RPN8/RPN11
MRTTLAMHESLWQELCSVAEQTLESAGVILAGIALEDERLTLIANRIAWVPDSAYTLRTEKEMKITSEGWMPALKAAADEGWQPIFFHTHPDAEPYPSARDVLVDRELTGPFRHRANADRYVSLILGKSNGGPAFAGSVIDDGGEFLIDRIRVVGPRLRVLAAHGGPVRSSADLTVFDRQIRAFGIEGQRAIADLRFGVVGASGTGSPVIEQLIRLGATQIVVIDDETITDTNITRIHGSGIGDVDKPKAELAREHANKIGLAATVEPVVNRITTREAMEKLRGCDVIFGCTDDFAGRAILSKIAYYYGILVIDMGVQLKPTDHGDVEVYERVTVMTAGHPCHFCTGNITADQVRNDLLSAEERTALAEEGYAPELEEEDPAVVTYTTQTATWAVDTLLQRLFGLGAESVGTLLVKVHEREFKVLPYKPKPGCFCESPTIWGRGDRRDPLDQVWLP